MRPHHHLACAQTGSWPRSQLRPLSDLQSLPKRRQPRSACYTSALVEAEEWIDRRATTHSVGSKQLVPPALPVASFRRALEPAISYDSGSEAQKEPQCEEEEEEVVSEVAFVRRHAPLELMEKHGYAAHPSIAKLMGGASVAATSFEAAVASGLVGRDLLVPPECFLDDPKGAPYRALVLRVRRGRPDAVDVRYRASGACSWFPATQAAAWVCARAPPAAGPPRSGLPPRAQAPRHSCARKRPTGERCKGCRRFGKSRCPTHSQGGLGATTPAADPPADPPAKRLAVAGMCGTFGCILLDRHQGLHVCPPPPKGRGKQSYVTPPV